MRVPLSWLREFVDIEMTVEQLADLLTVAGLEVAKIDYFGIEGGKDRNRLVWDRNLIVMARILEVNPHPDADRLVLATVEYGADLTETVVTGAPNLFEYSGTGSLVDQNLFSPFATEGAQLFDGHKEEPRLMRLKGRAIRGIYNKSMLCSEKELGLSEEHDGIIIMHGDYEPGVPLQEVLGDAVLDIEIIPNIARCASVLGVAREVAALTGKKVRLPDFSLEQSGEPIGDSVVIRSEEPELNPRFVGMVIRGVEQRESPYWMQHRLRLAGQRPINIVVDISNYVMLEMGEPNHAFDLDFLRNRANGYGNNGSIEIITRLPGAGETLTTLDGQERKLLPYNMLVCDPSGPLSIGGIMGGLESEISPTSQNILLEAASWDFMNIRRSANGLKIASEASFRFSRGVHPAQALLGARRAARLMGELAGGEVAQGVVDYYPRSLEPIEVTIRPSEVKRIAGIDLSADEIEVILSSLEFEVIQSEDGLRVTAPDYRLDIGGSHDVIEEICRIYGYDRLPATEMADMLPPQRANRRLEAEGAVKDELAAQGLQEVITYRLTTPEAEARLIPEGSGISPDDRPYVQLANSITVDMTSMRHSLLASVLKVAASNSRYRDSVTLFELGPTYIIGEDELLPEESLRLSIVMFGKRSSEHWSEKATDEFDFFDLKGIVERLLHGLHLEQPVFKVSEHPIYQPGRTAAVEFDDHTIGHIGELRREVADQFGVRSQSAVLVADLDAERLLACVPDAWPVVPISAYPAVREDIAIIVDKQISASAAEAIIRRAGGFLLKNVSLFDYYEGDSIPGGKKSLAFHLTFQSPSKTLTDKDVMRVRGKIVAELSRQVGARLRDA